MLRNNCLGLVRPGLLILFLEGGLCLKFESKSLYSLVWRFVILLRMESLSSSRVDVNGLNVLFL